MYRLLALAIALFVLTSAASAQAPERYADVRLHLADAQDLRTAFARAGVEFDHGSWEETESGPALLTTLAESDVRALRAAGVEVDVLVPDVTAAVAARAALGGCPTTPYPVTGTMACYPTHDEVLAIFDQMRAQYPVLISQRVSLGSSHEGRGVWMVEISDNPGVDEGEPEALFTALHHAREPQGIVTVLHTMWDLLSKYGTDPEATYLIQNRRMFFVPMLNPDGYVYNETIAPAGGGMWRKNRRDNGGGSFGVDPNRNYAHQWGLDDSGSSPNPDSEVYRGPAPFSEPENQAIRDFLAGREVRLAFNYHSHGDLLLHAWGYTPTPPPDMDTFTYYSQAMTAINGYVYGPGNTTIYPTNGSSDDWMYADVGDRPAIFAWTPEVGHSFWPDPSQILPIAEENLRANYLMAWYAGGFPEVSTSVYTEQEPAGNGHVDPGELMSMNVTLVNMGQSVAEHVHVDVLSTSPHLEIQCCPVPFVPSIAPGDSAQFAGFLARVDPGAPLGNLDGLTVQIQVNGDIIGTYPLPAVRIGTPQVVLDDPANTAAAWTPAGGWGLSTTAWSPPSSFADSPIGNYPANANATLTLTAPVSLVDAGAATLRFRTRWNIQDNFDFGQVLASTDGSTWTPLAGRHTVPGSGSGAQPAGQPGFEGINLTWLLEEMDMSAYAGAPAVYLQFRLRSNGSTQRDGWWVDDIVVERLIDGGTTAAEPPAAAPAPALAVAPNPSRAGVSVTISLSAPADARVAVYDALGRRVATLHDGPAPAGAHALWWDGRAGAGRAAPGAYVVRLEAAGASATRRLTLLR